MGEIEEGGLCPEGCGGILHFPDVENCSCHISPPCSAHTSVLLTCRECGWEDEPPKCDAPAHVDPFEVWRARARPSHDLGGRRVYDYDYDSRSGSTMAYEGRYEGPVTAQDIIDLLGDGTFGHRGPTLYGLTNPLILFD
jgi:hypothetical protein